MERGTVWIVGMMGSGKSTVGREVAERLGMPAEDTDERIVAVSGRSVSEIFAEQGEATFRALERDAIEALSGKPIVVSLGGGAMAQAGIPERLRAAGPVVYLMASAETLAARLGDGTSRPLLAGLDPQGLVAQLQALLDERGPAYEQADHHVSTEGLSACEVADQVVAALGADS